MEFDNFWHNIPEKVGNEKCFSFPPHLTSASALPDEMKKDQNSVLSLNAAVLLHCQTC